MISRAIGAAVEPPVPVWFSSATETAIRASEAGANATNHVVLRPATPVSAVPVFPATSTPEICAAVPVPAETAETIMSVSAGAVDVFIARPTSFGSCRTTTFPPRRADELHEVRLHEHAVVRDRRRDHRHLQRGDAQPLLSESQPAGIDLEVLLWEEELPALVEATRPLLVAGQLEAGIGVHAEPAPVVEDGEPAEALADLAEHGVDRVLQGLMEVDAAEWAVGVVVVDGLAVLDAVTRVGEARARGDLPGVERRCGGHELERRAGCVEAGRGAVEQPRRRRARRRAAKDLPVVPLHLVCVVAG